MNSIEKEFRADVAAALEPLSAQLIAVLAQLIAYPFVTEVVAVDFEIFCDQFTSAFPVRAFFMDAGNSEYFIYVDGEAQYPCSIDPGLLDIEGVYPYQLEEAYYQQDENLDTCTLAGEVLMAWFADCWIKAGGRNFPRKARIMLHDEDEGLELSTGMA